jgi:CheY-like chemotaxis protein
VAARILLVDDNEDIRTLGEISLAQVGGFDVRTADSGMSCLATLEEWEPDGVVLDVRMPEMDGVAVLREIRRTRPDLPIVLLTASVTEQDITSLRTLPVAGVLSKPFDPMTLPSDVREAFGW